MLKIIAVIVALTLTSGCTVPKLFEEERRYFEANVQNNPMIVHGTVEGIFYARSGNAAKPTFLFIHGTPGNWRFAARYMLDEELLRFANIASIDRPGWGRSRLDPEGKQVLRFADQAKRIHPLIEELKRKAPDQPLILVGHSLGASLSPLLALDYPDMVDGMILVAGALNPNMGKPRWYNLAASMGVVSWALGQEMRKANREIMPMHDDLAAIAARWDELNLPIMVIQGMDDGLVYPKNIDYAEKVFSEQRATIVRLPEVGHLIPWQHRELLTQYMLEFLQEFEIHETSRFSAESP